MRSGEVLLTEMHSEAMRYFPCAWLKIYSHQKTSVSDITLKYTI